MNIKLDENLPLRLASSLKELGHDVDTVVDEQRIGRPDGEIWAAAQAESRFPITQDLDFSDTRRFEPGSHHGILLVRLHSPSRQSLIERVVQLFLKEDLDEWFGSFVVATERKIRVQKPERKS